MSFDVDKLYHLLPALYRIRDAESGKSLLTTGEKLRMKQLQEELAGLVDQDGMSGKEKRNLIDELERGPLKALLAVIAEQMAVLEEDLEQLYDDQFIETCAEWVVPYIGDLVGARGLVALPDARFSQRAQVANTISYRRRKGTAAILEQLARDVTGWNASVVEYFQRLATTQYLNHLRPENLSLASLKRWDLLENLNKPFDEMAHTVDVRSIEKRRGKYNIPNIGIYLWRLDSFPLIKSPAYKVDELRYTFNALGKDIPLYNKPETEDEITQLAEPVNVPIPLTRRLLDRDLDIYYGRNKSLLVYKNSSALLAVEASPPANPRTEILSDIFTICDLSDLTVAGGWSNMPRTKIAIDPVLGRLAFPPSEPPQDVHVSFHYGFSSKMGGGGYSRAETFSFDAPRIIKVPSPQASTIQEALSALEISGGVVEIQDSEYYIEDLVIKVSGGKKIELRAADRQMPIIVLNSELLIIEGDANEDGGENAEVIINGLLISGGRVRVPANNSNQPNKLQHIRLRHCTLLPGPSPAIGEIAAQPTMPRLFIELPDAVIHIEDSITGGIRASDVAALHVSNSIIDATDETLWAFAGLSEQEPGASLHIQNSTIIGKVQTMLMVLASNAIFLSQVITSRLQQGCVRFSYYHPGSVLPRPYHCLPENDEDAARVRPVFTSMGYGDAGYCQLSHHCAIEIRQGADDQAEMGAFHNLYQSQRESNLRARLDEYLRFGLEAGIYFGS